MDLVGDRDRGGVRHDRRGVAVDPSRAPPFLTPLWAVIVGVTLGNLVRIIGTSVIALHDLRTFGVAVLGTVLLSLLWGLVLGLVAATVHRLMAPVARG